MALTLERAGIFRGRRDNRDAWYVVDPVGDGATDDVILGWRERYAATNSPRARRVIAWTAGWATFLVVVALSIAVAGFFFAETDLYLIGILVGFVGLVGGTWAAVSLHSRILPRVPLDGPAPPRVRKVDDDVLAWATDVTDAVDLWKLNLALIRVRQLHTAITYWGGDYDDEYEDRPDEVINHIIEPALLNAFFARRAEMRLVASRLDFTIPPTADSDPESLSLHAEK